MPIVWDVPEDMSEREMQLLQLCVAALTLSVDLYATSLGKASDARLYEMLLPLIASHVPGTNPRLR